ncbi:MAG: flagellin [Rickettsiales bacterium]
MAITGLTEAQTTPALTAYRRSSDSLATSAIRLGTNHRIIHTGDDSASVSAATNLQSQSSVLRSARVNGAKATSFLQVASNGLTQVRSILTSLSELVATANQTGLTDRQRTTLDAQFHSQLSQIDAVVAATTFNGQTILDGSASGGGAPQYQIGFPATSTIALTIPSVTSASLFAAPVALVTAPVAATNSVTVAQATVDDAIAKIDAYQVRLDAADAATKRNIFGVDHATDSILNTDTPAENRSVDRNHFQQQTTAALLAQTFNFNSSLLNLVR